MPAPPTGGCSRRAPDSGRGTARRLAWIGTATTLLEHSGFPVLTDPNVLRRGELALHGDHV